MEFQNGVTLNYKFQLLLTYFTKYMDIFLFHVKNLFPSNTMYFHVWRKTCFGLIKFYNVEIDNIKCYLIIHFWDKMKKIWNLETDKCFSKYIAFIKWYKVFVLGNLVRNWISNMEEGRQVFDQPLKNCQKLIVFDGSCSRSYIIYNINKLKRLDKPENRGFFFLIKFPLIEFDLCFLKFWERLMWKIGSLIFKVHIMKNLTIAFTKLGKS